MSTNDAGRAQLRAMIAKINAIGSIGETASPKVAIAVGREIVADTKEQVGPDGKPWTPTKSGTPALAHVEPFLSSRAVNGVVIVRLTGHYARHHVGAVKGGVKRPILPTGTVPQPMTRAIERVIKDEFALVTRGAR